MLFTQLPGTLDVEIVVGDEVAMSVDFDRDITGYTLEAPIYLSQLFVAGVGGAAAGVTQGETVAQWSILVADAAAGTVALGLSEEVTSSLVAEASYRWYLRWVDPSGYTRTVLSGSLGTRNP
jgi:hypothetical protein